MEFPATVPTNIYLLEGSSNIACVICIGAKSDDSPTSEAKKSQSEKSSIRGIERLRKTEIELRKSRILASLDKVRAELFTFYRKEDLQRDPKSVFDRVVNILRRNECHMSIKNAFRSTDLLRGERARLHYHFIAAIVSITKFSLEFNQKAMPLDSSSLLLPAFSPAETQNGPGLGRPDRWTLVNIYAQLLPNGQAVAILGHDMGTTFERISVASLSQRSASGIDKPFKVLLGLTGRYARYNNGHVGKLPTSTAHQVVAIASEEHRKAMKLERTWQLTWKALVMQWVKEIELSSSLEKDTWIEVELPMYRAHGMHWTVSEDFLLDGKMFWKRIFWPSSLCFINSRNRLMYQTELLSQIPADPLEFMENWVKSAAEREAVTAKLKDQSNTLSSTNSKSDNGQVLQEVLSPDTQGMTNIYPTPPDGALMQATEGIPSAEGAIVAPAEAADLDQTGRPESNVAMMNIMQGHAAVGSGLYDEDLFDDVPAQKIREVEMTDEPNWDFFDEPAANSVAITHSMESDASEVVEVTAEVTSPPIHNNFEGYDLNPATAVIKSPLEVDGNEYLGTMKGRRTQATSGIQNPSQSSYAPTQTRPRVVSPPLSPIDVKKKLLLDGKDPDLSSVSQIDTTGSSLRALTTDHTDLKPFLPRMMGVDSKYSANGKFWFPPAEIGGIVGYHPTSQEFTIPRIGSPQSKQSPGGSESPISENQTSPSSIGDSNVDSNEIIPDDETHIFPDGLYGDRVDCSADSRELEDDDSDLESETSIQEEIAQIIELLRDPGDEVSFRQTHQSFQSHENPTLPIDSEDLLAVAQVMVDQISQSVFHSFELGSSSLRSSSILLESPGRLQSIYGNATEIDLASLAEISVGTESLANDHGITECPTPLVRCSRGDAQVDVLPTIQPFWETLGLQPVDGPKNIIAFCTHPAGTHIAEGSANFLQRINEVYFNCNLGSHSTGNIEDMSSNGLIEWDIQPQAGMHKLLDNCEKLGSLLSSLPSGTENVVVYIVNPFTTMDAFADLCNAFVALFTMYAKARGENEGPELNLQILPMSFIASSETVAVPNQADYLSLALQVYSRCRSSKAPDGMTESGAAILVAKQKPTETVFDLTSDATSRTSKDRKHLHLAYSQTADCRWIIACWTDDFGRTTLTMTYCLRQKGSTAARTRSEVFKEMWEVSADIMNDGGGKWHLVVAQDGAMRPNEINEWSRLVNESVSLRHGCECALTLLTFEPHPLLQFFSPQSQSKPPLASTSTGTLKHGSAGSASSATAVGSSPEQVTASTPIPPTPVSSGWTAAPTPPDQTSQQQSLGFDNSTDPDATLVDPLDDCWSMVLSFGLNDPDSSLRSRPALLSGFLLKRRGPTDHDGLVALGVNLIHSSISTTRPQHASLLRELLGAWRGLYTLSRTKGLGGTTSVLPWHVRTAVMGRQAVAEVF